MSFKAFIVFSFAGLVASGCSTTYAPKKLADVTRNECVVVPEKMSYTGTGGLLKIKFEEGVTPGVYRAEKEDERGVFFRGSGRSVFHKNNTMPEKYFLRTGGVWLPKDPTQKAKLYSYIDNESYSVSDLSSITSQTAISSMNSGVGAGHSFAGAIIGGAIVNSMIQADVGKIFMWPDIKD